MLIVDSRALVRLAIFGREKEIRGLGDSAGLTIAGKGCPYRLDGCRQLDSTLLILPKDGREVGAANFLIFCQQHCHLADNCRT